MKSFYKKSNRGPARNACRIATAGGFTLVEVIVACAIITSSIFAVMSAAEKGITVSQDALKQMQGSLLLEEGAEAVKSIRDASWTNISGLTLGSTYYLSYNNTTNLWSLSTTPTSTIDSTFTRTVTLAAVSRDTNDDIVSSGGTVDSRTKQITITLSWSDSPGVTITKTLSFYIADIFT